VVQTHFPLSSLGAGRCFLPVWPGSAHQAFRLCDPPNPPSTCPPFPRHTMEYALPDTFPLARPGYAHLHAAPSGIGTDAGRPGGLVASADGEGVGGAAAGLEASAGTLGLTLGGDADGLPEPPHIHTSSISSG
jgi:hypothetical protein